MAISAGVCVLIAPPPAPTRPVCSFSICTTHPALCSRFVVLTGDALGAAVEFVTPSGAPTLGKPFAAADVRRIAQRAFDGS